MHLPPNLFEQVEYFYIRDILSEFRFGISVDKFDGIYGSDEGDFALLYNEQVIDENIEEFSGMNQNREYVFSCCQWGDESPSQRCKGWIAWLRIYGPERNIEV